MADADARTLYGDRPPMIGPPPDRQSGGHEASQLVDCGSCLDIAGHNGHDARIPNPQTSLVDILSTSSPRESESSPRSEVACRTLAVACIAGYGACKIAAWQSTLCADPRDVEMMCAGTSSRRCTPASSGYRSWLALMPLSEIIKWGVAAKREDPCGAPAMDKPRVAPRQWTSNRSHARRPPKIRDILVANTRCERAINAVLSLHGVLEARPACGLAVAVAGPPPQAKEKKPRAPCTPVPIVQNTCESTLCADLGKARRRLM
ncbi:hypothetical protein C8Q72DRAFT_944983 [Fomitopsis betulina]|nr:hypothetical protein C8Q72DRAFT_944983 [Fomitopsis betulina]